MYKLIFQKFVSTELGELKYYLQRSKPNTPQRCSRIAPIPIMGGLIAIGNAKKISLVHFRYSLKKSINTQPSFYLFFLVRTKPSSTLYTKRAVRLTRNFFENPYPVKKFVTTFLPGMGQFIFHVPITRPRFCFRQK